MVAKLRGTTLKETALRGVALKEIMLMHSPARYRAASRRSGASTSRTSASGTSTVIASATKIVRCAIYTRKSTEEGLEQAFNSLDAQREACAAYITSQRHEGWI